MPVSFTLSNKIYASELNIIQNNMIEFQNIINNFNPVYWDQRPKDNIPSVIPGYILEGNYQVGTGNPYPTVSSWVNDRLNNNFGIALTSYKESGWLQVPNVPTNMFITQMAAPTITIQFYYDLSIFDNITDIYFSYQNLDELMQLIVKRNNVWSIFHSNFQVQSLSTINNYYFTTNSKIDQIVVLTSSYAGNHSIFFSIYFK